MIRKYLFAIGLFCALAVGCSTSPPEPLEVSEVQEIEATVMAVDADSRVLVLQGPDGNEFGFRVGPEVRNLAQVEVGDILRVSYFTGLVFSMAEPGSVAEDAAIVVARAEEGDRPAAMIGATTSHTVEIISVASDGTAVSIRNAEGHLLSIDVPREEGQAFARKLSPGDLVDIQYTETIAVGIESAESDD